ncbi:MAG: PAS domain S-box protein [Nitrospirota bacterium]|nr:PAS domain S-box protein [Nitrospirota bacterium]
MTVSERVRRLHQRVSLMPKMLLLTVAVGALAMAVIDHQQTTTLDALFGDVLREQLGRQADEDRVRFDNYVETYHEAAKLMVSRKAFHDHVRGSRSFSSGRKGIVMHRDLPAWLPDAGILRHLVRIQIAVLLDGNNRVREIYHDGPGDIPAELRSPSFRLLAISAKQSAMVTLDNRPFVLTSWAVKSPAGRPLATLLIANELNEDFLAATRGGAAEERLVAVLAGEQPRVIASTRPDILPQGAMLDALRKDFLVIGKSFFDSGASELMMQFASFVPRSQFKEVHGKIVSAERKQRIAVAMLLIAASLVVVYFITRAVQQLAGRVVAISRDELGLEHGEVPRGDQLFILQTLFQRFTDEVIAGREQLRQQAAQSLKASEAKYQLLHESMRDAFVSVDMEGRMVDFNRAYQEMLGYRREELLPLTCKDITPGKWHAFEERIISEEVVPYGHSKVYEKEYRRKDGAVFPVEMRAFLLKDETGSNLGMWAIVRDITERKKAERELEIKNNAIEASINGIAISSIEGKITYANQAYIAMLGYSDASEVLGRDIKDFSADAERIAEIRNSLGGRDGWVGENTGRKKDGSLVPRLMSASIMRDETGTPISVLGSFVDISERIRAEEELRRARDFSESLIRAANAIVVVLNSRGEVMRFNEAAERITGYRKEDLAGRNWFETLAPRERYPEVWEEFAKLKERHVAIDTFTNPVLTKQGEERFISWQNSTLGTGDDLVIVSFGIDITERKRAEDALRDAEVRYRQLFERSPNGIVLIDFETGRAVEANDVACRQLGYTPEEFAGITISDYEVIEKPEETAQRLEKIKREGGDDFDTLHRTKSGEIRNVHVTVRTIEIGGRRFAYSIYQDITDRMQAEQRYQHILQTAIDGFWLTDAMGRLLDVNEAYCRMSGYSREEILRMHISDIEAGERPEETGKHIAKVVSQGYDRFTSRHRRKDGTIMDVEISVQFSKDRGGMFIAFLQDITERKRAADALRDAEARYRQLFEQSPNGVLLVDFETGKALEANEVAARQLGYTPEEFSGLTISDYEVIEKPEETARRLEKIQREGGDDFDTLHRTKSGEIRNVHVSVKALELGGRTLAYTIFQDVTDRMQAEQRYRRIMQTAIDGFWATDLSGRVVDVNDAFCRMTGYSRDELLQMSIPDVEAVENPEETARHIETVIAQGHDRFETKHRRKDGTIYDVEINVQTTRDEGGRFIAFVQDITKRKRDADAISASLREKETLLREIHHRVKNNLQIISSLLYFQSKKVADPSGLAALREGQDRLKSMILVHEKLYRSQDLARVDFGDYVRSLTDQMLQSYGTVRNRVAVSVQAGDVRLSIEIALPLGMIINELLTNVLKYAFPGGQSGAAFIRVAEDHRRLTVEVRDQGAGLPPGTDVDNPSTFGLQLVRNLARQLGGTISFERSGGTIVTIDIPLDKETDRSGS